MDKKVRVRWTNEAIKCFLETCIEEVNKVGRNGGSLQKETWAKLAIKLDEVCHIKLTQRQLKNQYDYLKAKYSGWAFLKDRGGNMYDSEMNMFNLSNQEWEDFYKGHPQARTLRTSPLLFPELCIALFEGTSATSLNRERPVVSSSSTSLIKTTRNEENDDEEEEEDMHTYVQRSQKPNVEGLNATSSRPKKRSKKSANLNEFAESMIGLLHSLVAQETSNLGACIDRLNTLGLHPRDPLHCAAIDIFGHSTLLRETWLIIPPTFEELTHWISRTARRLGFME